MPNTTNDKRWTTGDLTLISADNVIFRVKKELVMVGRYVSCHQSRDLADSLALSSVT